MRWVNRACDRLAVGTAMAWAGERYEAPPRMLASAILPPDLVAGCRSIQKRCLLAKTTHKRQCLYNTGVY